MNIREQNYLDVISMLGEDNRISKWLRSIENNEGIEEAIKALEEYTEFGCGISG